MNKKLCEIICSKDENSARAAAEKLINTRDLKEFEALCEKAEFLFDFVRENVCKRLTLAINKNNFRNIIVFFDCYSPTFDELFSSVLAKYANEDLTDEILEILTNGTDSQKAYAASYFKKIPDTAAKDDLIENLDSDFEPLFENCAAALGKMNDTISYEKYLNNLNSEDDFTKLKAVKFLISYGNKDVLGALIKSMESSSMSENIAGEIAALYSPFEILKNDFKNGITLCNNLVSGLGEILPLENIFYYEFYEILEFLFSLPNSPEAALILFNMKDKFDTLTQNEEYTFDLDKNTKNEIFEIKKLLSSKNNDFWEKEKVFLSSLINEDNPYLHNVLEIIRNNGFKDFTAQIKDLLTSENETTVYEAALALKELGELQETDKTKINLKNPNLNAAFEQLFAT